MSNEVGAAIMLQPNASRVLDAWGFDTGRGRLVEATKSIFAHAGNLQTFSELEFVDLEGTYGARFWFAHRGDLHEELRRLATQEDGTGKAVVVEKGMEVVEFVRLSSLRSDISWGLIV